MTFYSFNLDHHPMTLILRFDLGLTRESRANLVRHLSTGCTCSCKLSQHERFSLINFTPILSTRRANKYYYIIWSKRILILKFKFLVTAVQRLLPERTQTDRQRHRYTHADLTESITYPNTQIVKNMKQRAVNFLELPMFSNNKDFYIFCNRIVWNFYCSSSPLFSSDWTVISLSSIN